jgi:hypothetical protein
MFCGNVIVKKYLTNHEFRWSDHKCAWRRIKADTEMARYEVKLCRNVPVNKLSGDLNQRCMIVVPNQIRWKDCAWQGLDHNMGLKSGSRIVLTLQARDDRPTNDTLVSLFEVTQFQFGSKTFFLTGNAFSMILLLGSIGTDMNGIR